MMNARATLTEVFQKLMTVGSEARAKHNYDTILECDRMLEIVPTSERTKLFKEAMRMVGRYEPILRSLNLEEHQRQIGKVADSCANDVYWLIQDYGVPPELEQAWQKFQYSME